MALSLRSIENYRTHDLDDFRKSLPAVRGGELGIVALSIHDENQRPLSPGVRHIRRGPFPTSQARINRVSDGLYRGTLRAARGQVSQWAERRPLLVNFTSPALDVGPHIDPTREKPLESRDDIRLAHHYTPFGEAIGHAAGLEGDIDELTGLNREVRGKLAKELLGQFWEVASPIEINSGDVLAFMAFGRQLQSGEVVPQIMHDISTTTSARALIVR